MNSFKIINKTEYKIKEINKIKALLNYALKKEHLNKAVFSVIFVTNQEIKKINSEYRNKAVETDVITFALEDDQSFPNVGYRILGDIYVSIDKAYEQCELYNHSFLRELSFLVIHGFYHLLGYDHMTPEDEKIMFKKQEDILTELKIGRDL